jgi:transmembrane sensor
MLAPLVGLSYLLGKGGKSIQMLFSSKLTTSATLLLSSVFCAWLILVSPNGNDIEGLSNEYVTNIGEQAKHLLPDGSTIWLNSSSHVEVTYSKNYRRIYLLLGEAHFKVEKDPSRPFEVYSEDRLVRAIGTAFSVYRRNDRIEILVSEGKVELAIVDQTLVITPDDYPSNQKQKLTQTASFDESESADMQPAIIIERLGELEAGDSISILTTKNVTIEDAQKDVIKLENSDIIRKLSWLDGKLVFAGESLEEVVTEISRHTSMQIDVPDPVLKKMRIGGHFKAGETDTLFAILESGFGIQVNRLGENHVELHAKK